MINTIDNNNVNIIIARNYMDINQVPEISNPVFEIFAKHTNCLCATFKPKSLDLCLKSRVRDLNKLDAEIEKTKNNDNLWRRIVDVTILALNVAAVAFNAFHMVTFPFGPLHLIFATIHSLLAAVFAVNLYNSSPETLESERNEKVEIFNERTKMLEKIIEQHSRIRQGIETELSQIDGLNVNRKEQLTLAKNELDKAVAFFDKLNNPNLRSFLLQL